MLNIHNIVIVAHYYLVTGHKKINVETRGR